MFTHLKKDYYSVNANVSISPVRQQMMMLTGDEIAFSHEINQQAMITDGGEAGADGTMQLMAHNTGYQSENSPRRSVSPTNTIMVQPSLLMGQPPRYDEVYYPRTDKRMISKFILHLKNFAN